MLRECCADISKSSPGNHSGLGDTTLERDPWPDWCTQKGVSPVSIGSARVDNRERTKQHTYAQRFIVILVLRILTLSEDIERAILSLLWILRQVV
jgi:hypothetical protein